jgi:3-oxoacyl-[acyl-carrier protein] reductase
MTTHLNSKKLQGKVAFVTGSSRRIGRSVALRLADAGANVVVHARSSIEEIEAVAKEVEARGQRSLALLGDVTVEADVKAIFQRIDETFGRLDMLVNNAAIRGQCDFTDMSLDEWRRVNSVILDGAFLCSREGLKRMVRNEEGGSIVNIGGVSAHIGAKSRAHVSTSKAGLVGLTRALAVEFADRKINVNCVAPGKIGGERSKTSGESPHMPGADNILVGREGLVEEASFMIANLCMPEAKFMTGQTVHVSGGLVMP